MKKLSKEIENQVVSLYTNKADNGTWAGCNTIAKSVGISKTSVQNILSRNGITLRTPKQAFANGKQTKPIKNIPPTGEPIPLCKCGCGKPVSWNRRKNKWNAYVVGHYRPKRPYQSRKWMIDEYINKSRTMEDIAKECNASRVTIRRYLKKFNLRVRSQGESLALSGAASKENNPAWKGGVSEWDYAYNWKSITKSIKDRDKWTCQSCGKTRSHWGYELHVHHKDGNKLNNSPDNLISLCAKCHREVHSGIRTI